MLYCKTATILDNALTLLHDNSAPMRARMLSWLNSAMLAVTTIPREWEFLKRTTTLAVTASVATIPADCVRITSIYASNLLFTQPLTDSEYYEATENTALAGFIYDSTSITLVNLPDATSISLKYTAGMTGTYPDDTADTIFPIEFSNCFSRVVTSAAYEFDKDNDTALSMQLSAGELTQMKALDNLRKPQPARSPHGYIRA